MTAPKINALRFVVLFVAPLLWAQSAAQVPANPKFKAEISRQESIYRSEGDRVPSG